MEWYEIIGLVVFGLLFVAAYTFVGFIAQSLVDEMNKEVKQINEKADLAKKTENSASQA